MNFSTKVRYGTRAMIDIARMAGTDGGVTITAVAESQELSRKYLESLLVQMRKAGLLKSRRGKAGGYSLNRAAAEISVYDIVVSLDGPFELVDCSRSGQGCPRIKKCDTEPLWKHLTSTLAAEMKRITLEDLMDNRSRTEVRNG